MSYAEYKAHGWQLCDIPPGTKGPTVTGWNLPGAISHGQQGCGICHAYSGTCAIDVDDYPVALEWLARKGVDLDALLEDPRSVQIVSGRINRAKLLYRLPTPLPSLNLAPYEKLSEKTGKMATFHALELRCGTRDGKTVQDVLPPTIHPETGKPYTWAYGDETFGHWSNLPELPSALLALWQAEQVSLPAPQGPVAVKGARADEIRELLSQQDPDDYANWIRMGQAIHHETKGSADGLALFDEWSRRSAKYGQPNAAGRVEYPKDKWPTFGKNDSGTPVTLGSLRREHMATPEQFAIVETAQVGDDTRSEQALRRILESRLVFVSAQEMYYDLQARGQPWLTDRGLRHVFCPHMPTIKVAGKNGKPDKFMNPDPVTHLQNSKTKTIVDMVGMHPGAPRLYEENGLKFVNFFLAEKIEDLAPLAHEKEAFTFLWSRMKDPVFRSWLLKFYAFALQRPGVKIQSAPLLVSAEQGTGKNTLMKVLPETMFGSRYVRTMSGSVLASQFNGAIGQTWWLYLEELRAGANKTDRMHTTNKIKSWITDNSIEVHKKGLEAYDIPNRVQVTATTNFDDALQLDNNDRRWAIGEMCGPITPRESLDLYGFLLSERAPGVLRHIFRHVDITGFQPTAKAPETMAKKAMIVAGIGGWEAKIVEAMVGAEPPFDRDLFRLKDISDLMMGQGITAHALGRLLKRAPFRCELLGNGRTSRIWAWRNQTVWQRLSEGERLRHLQTGERPAGCLTNVPAPILAMSADAGVDSANADLL